MIDFGSSVQFQAITPRKDKLAQERLAEGRQGLAEWGRAALWEGIKLPVTSQPGKEAEEYDRSLRRRECHRALKRERYSTKATVSAKQVSWWFFFFMWHLITLWDFWLLQDGRKPKIYIALKLALQTHRRKIYCELLRGKISPLCQVDTSPLLMKVIAKDHSLFSAYSYTLPSVTGLCQRKDREPVKPPWSVSVQLLPYSLT